MSLPAQAVTLRLRSLTPMAPVWINSPVLLEALQRHHEGRLSGRLSLWLQELLELPVHEGHDWSDLALSGSHQGNSRRGH